MASCEDCMYVEVCPFKHYRCENDRMEKRCSFFRDHSLFVELPCKVGDSVFIIDKKENIQECVVTNVNCKTQMMLDKEPWIDFIIVTEPVDDSLPFPMIFTYSITNHCTLFLTKEHAEQALKEREA